MEITFWSSGMILHGSKNICKNLIGTRDPPPPSPMAKSWNFPFLFCDPLPIELGWSAFSKKKSFLPGGCWWCHLWRGSRRLSLHTCQLSMVDFVTDFFLSNVILRDFYSVSVSNKQWYVECRITFSEWLEDNVNISFLGKSGSNLHFDSFVMKHAKVDNWLFKLIRKRGYNHLTL